VEVHRRGQHSLTVYQSTWGPYEETADYCSVVLLSSQWALCQQKPWIAPPEDTGFIENWSLLPCCYVRQSEPFRYSQSSYATDAGVVPLISVCLVFANPNIRYPDLSVYFMAAEIQIFSLGNTLQEPNYWGICTHV